MGEPYRIVGIMLIKDEDLYIERVIRNVIDFCDELVITENYSEDRTYQIVCSLAQQFPNITLHRINHVRESHTLLEHLAGTRTWVFGVDGDEIYDPHGLSTMHQHLHEGAFDDQWLIFGNVLHCTQLDPGRKKAKGYLAPPSRSMTKLYNFALIDKWVNGIHRLHCGDIAFKTGYHAGLRYQLGETMSWEESYFRCLHTVFVRRSSLQKTRWVTSRWNPSEVSQLKKKFQRTLRSRWKIPLRIGAMFWNARLLFRRDWKNQQYKKGRVVTKDIAAFFSE